METNNSNFMIKPNTVHEKSNGLLASLELNKRWNNSLKQQLQFLVIPQQPYGDLKKSCNNQNLFLRTYL